MDGAWRGELEAEGRGDADVIPNIHDRRTEFSTLSPSVTGPARRRDGWMTAMHLPCFSGKRLGPPAFGNSGRVLGWLLSPCSPCRRPPTLSSPAPASSSASSTQLPHNIAIFAVLSVLLPHSAASRRGGRGPLATEHLTWQNWDLYGRHRQARAVSSSRSSNVGPGTGLQLKKNACWLRSPPPAGWLPWPRWLKERACEIGDETN